MRSKWGRAAGVLAAASILVWAAAACTSAATPVPAAPAAPPQGISGSVKVGDSGEPVSRAEVALWKGPSYTASVATTKTDDSGEYVLAMPEPGDYRIVVSHPEYSFSPVFASISVKADVPSLVNSFTAQKGNILRIVLSPLGTQMPVPGTLGAIVYKEEPSFESPTADGIQMANKEADGSYYLSLLLKETKSYYQVCPVARDYIFEPECAGVNTPDLPGIVSLPFSYRPR